MTKKSYLKGGFKMVTNQIMESQDRLLDGVIIRQRTKDEFFSLRDTEKLINRMRFNANADEYTALRLDRYFALDSTKKFIQALKDKKGCEVYIAHRGKREGWIHPHLFLDIILWANPEFKVTIYDWLFDYLIASRISSGDSYRIMCGVLYEFADNKKKFKNDIQELCRMIKTMILTDENKSWNTATKEQLKARDDVQMMIADLTTTLRNAKQGVKLGLMAYEQRKLYIKRREV